MSKNPFYNAIAAAGYIVVIASIMFYGSQFLGPNSTVIIPITMLSLFVLSAAVMSYLFVYQPAIMYLDGEKQAGVKLFAQTVGVFACITILFLAIGLLTN